MTRATRIAGIDGTETCRLRQGIVVKTVAIDEASRVRFDVLDPFRLSIVGKRRVNEHRAHACTQGITLVRFEVGCSKAIILPVASDKEEEQKDISYLFQLSILLG